jgi:type I restriction enzyme R subunit
MVDEAHRTQEGDLGRKVRDALPNAFLFGLTGTPTNRADRYTHSAFSADEDEKGYPTNDVASIETHRKTALSIHCFATSSYPFRESKDKFCKRFARSTGHSGTFSAICTF